MKIQKIVEKQVRSMILELLEKDTLTIDEIVKQIRIRTGLKRIKILRIINDLIDEGLLAKIDYEPPINFLDYLKSGYSLWFWSIIMISLITLYTIYLMPQIYPILYFRYILGSILILFLPGYALIESIFPRHDELNGIERFSLSIALSIGIVALEGFILNYTPWGIRLEPILIALISTTLILSIISIFRKLPYLKLLNQARKA
jgi:hypothetical protein